MNNHIDKCLAGGNPPQTTGMDDENSNSNATATFGAKDRASESGGA